jgi:hypothetical protein
MRRPDLYMGNLLWYGPKNLNAWPMDKWHPCIANFGNYNIYGSLWEVATKNGPLYSLIREMIHVGGFPDFATYIQS